LQFNSAERPQNLRGVGLGSLVVDEAGQMLNPVYTQVLRPALMDHKARGIFIGTPYYDNFFTTMHNDTIAGKRDDVTLMSYSSYDNPFIDKAEIDATVEELKSYPNSELLIRQEIFGEHVKGGASVFIGLEKCITVGVNHQYNPQHMYTMGVDLAIERDNSVICVIDNNQHAIVRMDVMTGLRWAEQEDRICEINNAYGKPTIYIDATNQSKVADDLAMYYALTVEPIRFSRANKQEYIHRLARYIGKGILKIPEQHALVDTASLINEMNNYVRVISTFGNEQFRAKRKMKDDRVMALALAVSDMSDFVDMREITPVDVRKRVETFKKYGILTLDDANDSGDPYGY
jgi:phage FluMu gp28-like protein